jgi:hypothetical protein
MPNQEAQTNAKKVRQISRGSGMTFDEPQSGDEVVSIAIASDQCRRKSGSEFATLFAGRKNKKARQAGLLEFRVPNKLERLDVRRLFAFWTSGHVERDFLVFGERLEAARLDRGEVHEQIVAGFIGSDETKTFCIVEPLYCACCHYLFLISM